MGWPVESISRIEVKLFGSGVGDGMMVLDGMGVSVAEGVALGVGDCTATGKGLAVGGDVKPGVEV